MATDWVGQLDPAERIEFIAGFGGEVTPVLAPDETITSFSLAVTATAAALGLTIEDDGDYVAQLITGYPSIRDNTAIRIWFSIDPAFRNAPEFENGIRLAVVATIQTSSTPPRTRERTFTVEVKQL